MSWDWSTQAGRNGALRNLMIHPGEIIERTNACWDQLAPPKEYWTAKLAERANIQASGKTVIYLLMERMIAEYIRRMRRIPRYEDARDAGEAMKIDLQGQEIWHRIANKYADLLDLDDPDEPRQERPASVILFGPWGIREVARDARRNDTLAEAAVDRTDPEGSTPDRRTRRKRTETPQASTEDVQSGSTESHPAEMDCLRRLYHHALHMIDAHSTLFYEAFQDDWEEGPTGSALHQGVVLAMIDRILGSPTMPGHLTPAYLTQIALARAILLERAPLEMPQLVSRSLKLLNPKAFATDIELATPIMVDFIVYYAKNSPWIIRDEYSGIISYDLNCVIVEEIYSKI